MQPVTKLELSAIFDRTRRGEDLNRRQKQLPVLESYFRRRNELIAQVGKLMAEKRKKTR